MNKYQEALDIIADNIGRNKKHSTWEDGILTISPKWNESYMTLKQLIDKETPMKTNGSHCGKCDIYLAKTMPFVFQYKISNYCPNCGQKIGWSKDNE